MNFQDEEASFELTKLLEEIFTNKIKKTKLTKTDIDLLQSCLCSKIEAERKIAGIIILFFSYLEDEMLQYFRSTRLLIQVKEFVGIMLTRRRSNTHQEYFLNQLKDQKMVFKIQGKKLNFSEQRFHIKFKNRRIKKKTEKIEILTLTEIIHYTNKRFYDFFPDPVNCVLWYVRAQNSPKVNICGSKETISNKNICFSKAKRPKNFKINLKRTSRGGSLATTKRSRNGSALRIDEGDQKRNSKSCHLSGIRKSIRIKRGNKINKNSRNFPVLNKMKKVEKLYSGPSLEERNKANCSPPLFSFDKQKLGKMPNLLELPSQPFESATYCGMNDDTKNCFFRRRYSKKSH